MELILNTHYKYDTFGRYYYLTPTGAELITGIDSLDNDWTNVERRLKSQGKLLKSFMSFATNDDYRPQYSKADYVEYAQYSDTNVRNSVFKLLGEFAEASWDSDIDRMVYEERNPLDAYNFLPITMIIEGAKYGLLSLAAHQFFVPTDEYQVGY
jgi:hypothetical protein